MALHYLNSDVYSNGVIELNYFDADTGNLVVHTKYDATQLMERQKQKRNSGFNGYTNSRDFREIAEIDDVTIYKLLVEHNIDVNKKEDMPRLKKWLKERDNKGFLSVDGSI